LISFWGEQKPVATLVATGFNFFREFSFFHPPPPHISQPELYPLASALRGKQMISVLPGNPLPFKEQQRSMSNAISLTTNRTNFHEWGAASPENFIVGLIRVYSKNSWFKCSTLGHPSRTGFNFFREIFDLRLPGKPRAFKEPQRSMTDGIF
jgi:hypothetical protein